MSKATNLKRYLQLDFLRGFAALSVVIFHYVTRFQISEIGHSFSGDAGEKLMYIFKFTPLHIFWNGHEAVILFYILSGFVLSLAFSENDKINDYGIFLIKRVCRIYLPYIAVIIFAVILKNIFYSGEINGLSMAFNDSWKPAANEIDSLKNHFLMIGNFDTNVYNGVIWSLVHEMRITIILPFLLLYCKKFGFGVSIVTAAALSFCAYFIIITYDIQSNANIFMTMHYAGFFILGIAIAIYRDHLSIWFNRLRDIKLMPVIFCTAILIYTFSAWNIIPYLGFKSEIIGDWIIAIGASLFIIVAVSVEAKTKVFRSSFMIFIGSISYSLYLWHMVILNTFIHAFYRDVPIYIILPAAFILTIFVSWLSFRFIEIPSKNLGNKLSGIIIERRLSTFEQVEAS